MSKTTTSTPVDAVAEAASALAAASAEADEARAAVDRHEQEAEALRALVRAGEALPQGSSVAAAEDRLATARLRLDGAQERLTKAEDTHADAEAQQVAAEVAEALHAVDQTESEGRLRRAVADAVAEYVETAESHNRLVNSGISRMRRLPEDRYGPSRRVGNVSIGQNFGSRPSWVQAGGVRHERVGVADRASRIIADALLAGGFHHPSLTLQR